MTQTAMLTAKIAAAKTIRKVLVSSAMECPFPGTGTMHLFLRLCKRKTRPLWANSGPARKL